MSLEKSLSQLNRAYLVVGLLVVVLLAARAFQRSNSSEAQPAETHPTDRDVLSSAASSAQIEALETELATVTKEREALRGQVDEKEAQNAKLRASIEAMIKDLK